MWMYHLLSPLFFESALPVGFNVSWISYNDLRTGQHTAREYLTCCFYSYVVHVLHAGRQPTKHLATQRWSDPMSPPSQTHNQLQIRPQRRCCWCSKFINKNFEKRMPCPAWVVCICMPVLQSADGRRMWKTIGHAICARK